jgi:hypothetical protein
LAVRLIKSLINEPKQRALSLVKITSQHEAGRRLTSHTKRFCYQNKLKNLSISKLIVFSVQLFILARLLTAFTVFAQGLSKKKTIHTRLLSYAKSRIKLAQDKDSNK